VLALFGNQTVLDTPAALQDDPALMASEFSETIQTQRRGRGLKAFDEVHNETAGGKSKVRESHINLSGLTTANQPVESEWSADFKAQYWKKIAPEQPETSLTLPPGRPNPCNNIFRARDFLK
jgi:hypothetical protein